MIYLKRKMYPDIRCGIKLAGSNIGYDGGIYTFPYFCAFLLKRYLREADMSSPRL